MCLVKGFPCFHRHRAEAFHQGAIAQEGSHHSSVSQVCIRGCQHNSLQFPFLYRSGCTAGSRATALWLCPRTARAHSYKSFSESSLLIEPAQGKVPYLPEFPKEQTSTRYFLTAQSKMQDKLPRLPSATVLLSGEQRTPTSSVCEQSCCPQLLWGQSRRESSVPTQATSSSKIKPWPAA